MVALLVAMSVMAIAMSVAMPAWKTASQREKEAELIFRGQQYARAIELYQRRLPGAMPPNLDVLIDQKFLRKKYKDPITNDDFDLLSPNSPAAGQLGPQPQGGPAGTGQTGRNPQPGSTGAGQTGRNPAPATSSGRGPQGGTIGAAPGIAGVASKSKATSLRVYNGRTRYNEWQFVYIPRTAAPGTGAPGTGAPGARGPGQRGGPGPMPPGTGPGGLPPGGSRGPLPPGGGTRGIPQIQPGGMPGSGPQPYPQAPQPVPQQPRSPGN
jgi:type II secretory pathway pseudopilin PulG